MLLKQKVAPTNKAQKMQLVTQYTKLKKAPKNQNFKIWLQKWEKMYTEYVEQKLPEIKSNQLVRDFMYAVKSVSLSRSEYWKNKFQRLDWKKETLLNFFKLVKLYQNHYHIELTQKAKILQRFFAATFKKKLNKSLKPKPELSANK